MDSPKAPKTHYVRCLRCSKILECSRYNTNCLLDHIRIDHPEIVITDNNNDNNYDNSNNNNVNGMPRNGQTTMREAAAKIVAPHDTIEDAIDDTVDDKPSPIRPTMFERSRDSQSEEFEKFQPRSTSSRERLHIRTQRESPFKREKPNCDTRAEHSNDNSGVYTRRYQVHTPSTPTYNERPSRSLYRTSIEKWRPATGTIYCPKCGASRRPLIRTQTERSSNNSCCAVCILGCWPFCFLPFLLPSDNKEYLHCSNCKTFLGLYDRANNCVKPNREYCQAEETVINETGMRVPDGASNEKRNCRCA